MNTDEPLSDSDSTPSTHLHKRAAPIYVRPFEDRDYERLALIAAAINPYLDRGLAWYRQSDHAWDPALLRVRLVAESDSVVVGWGDVSHMWWAFHPRKFVLRLNVDPAYQQRGIGSQLYAALMQPLTGW